MEYSSDLKKEYLNLVEEFRKGVPKDHTYLYYTSIV